MLVTLVRAVAAAASAILIPPPTAITQAARQPLTPLTPRTYRMRVSEVCHSTRTRYPRLSYPLTRAGVVTYLERTAAVGGAALEDLRRLQPPTSMRAGHDRALRYIALQLALYMRTAARVKHGMDPSAAFRNDRPEDLRLARLEDAEWRKLRVPACIS
jgi:hypothetical protein